MPRCLRVGPLTLGKEHPAFTKKYHAHPHLRPGREVSHRAEYSIAYHTRHFIWPQRILLNVSEVDFRWVIRNPGN